MRKKKRIIATSVVCIIFLALAYFALYLPFYKFPPESYGTSLEKIFSLEYIKTLVPLFIIAGASALGIILTVCLRKKIMQKGDNSSKYANRYGRGRGKAVKHKPALFMIVRWIIMIVFAFMMIWGGLLFGLRSTDISLPIFSCPANNVQMAEASCYFLSHPKDLFEELPVKNIIIFLGSTLLFTVLLGRVMCGFLCPMGLVQDIMDRIRKKQRLKAQQPTKNVFSFQTGKMVYDNSVFRYRFCRRELLQFLSCDHCFAYTGRYRC